MRTKGPVPTGMRYRAFCVPTVAAHRPGDGSDSADYFVVPSCPSERNASTPTGPCPARTLAVVAARLTAGTVEDR